MGDLGQGDWLAGTKTGAGISCRVLAGRFFLLMVPELVRLLLVGRNETWSLFIHGDRHLVLRLGAEETHRALGLNYSLARLRPMSC